MKPLFPLAPEEGGSRPCGWDGVVFRSVRARTGSSGSSLETSLAPRAAPFGLFRLFVVGSCSFSAQLSRRCDCCLSSLMGRGVPFPRLTMLGLLSLNI